MEGFSLAMTLAPHSNSKLYTKVCIALSSQNLLQGMDNTKEFVILDNTKQKTPLVYVRMHNIRGAAAASTSCPI